MRIDSEPKLDFDDVLIRPKRSEAPSRSSIILEREHRFLNSGSTWKGIPIVASNMDTVGTMAMAKALGPEMMTCLHKYYSDESLIDFFNSNHDCTNAFFTLGINDDEFEKLKRVEEQADVRFVCVDAANGYTKFFVERVKRIRDAFSDLTIMAGNVATPDMVQELLISGAADIVKIGIGPWECLHNPNQDSGGLPASFPPSSSVPTPPTDSGAMFAPMAVVAVQGDVVKAFAAGADFVMLGSMLAGHDECEGEWVEEDGQRASMEVLRDVQSHGAGQVRRRSQGLSSLRGKGSRGSTQRAGEGNDPRNRRRYPKCLRLCGSHSS